MRLLRRNTTTFSYRAYTGQAETMNGTLHTGEYAATYANPVTYRGNISSPTGSAASQLFGLNVQYSHVLLMDKPDADITEHGLIDWNGDTYEITAVRKSFNVLSVGLKKLTKNYAPATSTSSEPATTEQTGGGDSNEQDN